MFKDYPIHSDEERKALNGMWYRSGDDKYLSGCYRRARSLCFRLNGTPPEEASERRSLLEALLYQIGEGVTVVGPFFCDMGQHTSIGDNSFINAYVTILDGAFVSIGQNVLIAPHVGLYTNTHPIEDVAKRNAGYERSLPITIEDEVWIGAAASIMAGVTIGKQSVVGAGSVVTHDIPPRCVVAGNPAKIIRHL